jgi:hypothetical protein
MGEFVLRIKLGSSAMQSAEDVAWALRKLADLLEQPGPTDGKLMDLNGNAVGSWTLVGQLP